MEKRRIGSLEVSVVGLGCNNFGGRLDAEATARVLNATLDAGINFFDTADIYGGTRSEEFMGRAFGTRRDEIVLATKFGHKVDETRRGASPAYIAQAVEDSLRRLQTDRIDLYQLHTPDASVPIADTLEALDKLVKVGKVREIGCSNFSVTQLREAEAAVKQGAMRFVSVQNEYSLLDRSPEEDGVLAETEKTAVAVLPYFPLANGMLTGKYRKGQPLPEGTRIKEGHDDLTDKKMDTVEALIAFSEAQGHTILDLAFSWLLAHPTVVSVIAGATKPEQVQANAGAAHWKLTEPELAEVNRILSA